MVLVLTYSYTTVLFEIYICKLYWLICILSVDLQLDVKGCRDVYASFDKYVEVERLEGDNKYHAEQYGLQVGCFETLWFEFHSK